MTPRVATLATTTLPKPYLRLAARSVPCAATRGLRNSSTTPKRSTQCKEAFPAPRSDLISEVSQSYSHPV